MTTLKTKMPESPEYFNEANEVNGYTTVFDGRVEISPPLSATMRAYLSKFCDMKHVRRDQFKALCARDTLRHDVGLPHVGLHGEYFTGDDRYSIIMPEERCVTQPSFFCDWRPTSDGTALVWNRAENSQEMAAWLKYLIDEFLEPNNYTLDGVVKYAGEHKRDCGIIVVKNNDIVVQPKRASHIGAAKMWADYLNEY
ncbi:hypothetical protein GGF31_003442 [Allomyces arbusculus]|nr:hypothetical protein GGF31_003442 [Allomyces arbusculus]